MSKDFGLEKAMIIMGNVINLNSQQILFRYVDVIVAGKPNEESGNIY